MYLQLNKKKVLTIMILLITAVFIPHLQAQTPAVNEQLWGTNGTIYSTVISGGIAYIGGTFNQVGLNSGHGASFDASSGISDDEFPRVDNAIFAVLPDGSGGWYIAGRFENVGGIARTGLAHIKSDKTVDMDWDPNIPGFVRTIAISGNTLYAGGSFTTVNGSVTRHNLAAFDLTTGIATNWNPNPNNSNPNDYIDAIVISGNTVYVGGSFATVNDGLARNSLAAFDAVTGIAKSWNPDVRTGANMGYVYSMAVSGSTVYAGGSFNSVNGNVNRSNLAAFDATTGTVTNWDPNIDNSGHVQAIAISGNTVYAGGWFTTVNGNIARNSIAAFDVTTGTVTNWDPNIDIYGYVRAIAISGNTVYIGADFNSVNGSTNRNHLAAFDATSGAVTNWNPYANSYVRAIALSGGKVYAGGEFSIVNGYPRNNLAAIDLATGKSTSWDPNVSYNNGGGEVRSLAVLGNTIYAGGTFTRVNENITRNNIAAFDISTGNATSWDPDVNSGVLSFAISGSTIYAGGWFTTVNGSTTRNYLAAFDLTTGLVTSWNPNLGGYAYSLAISGSTIYAGGSFQMVNGNISRNRLAAFDLTTGITTSWNPNVGGSVEALAVSGSTMYAGGSFQTVNGNISRNRLAAFDITTGTATSWNPDVNGDVYTLAVSGSTIYAGGGFLTVNGNISKYRLAAFDITTGTTTSWNPDVVGVVLSLNISQNSIYASGSFSNVAGVPRPNFASINDINLQSLTYLNPDGGQTFEAGTHTPITWSSQLVNNINIEYSADNKHTWNLIASNVSANSGSYSWLVPQITTVEAFIKISDSNFPNLFDISNGAFAIYQHSNITVVSPNGSENWEAGSTQKIFWSSSSIDNVKLEYSIDNGANWIEIISSTPALTSTTDPEELRLIIQKSRELENENFSPSSILSKNNFDEIMASAGSYDWTLPATLSSQALIRISDATDPLLDDVSDNTFSIVTPNSTPVLNLTSPDGDEFWEIGTTQPIRWISANITNVKLEYTINNGTNWSEISASTPASGGTFAWNIPSPTSTLTKVRVTDIGTSGLTDISGSVFNIYATQGGAPVPILSWPSNGVLIYSNSPSLYWYLNTQATGNVTFDLEYTDITLNSSPVTITSISSMNSQLNSLVGGHTYSWRVRTRNGIYTSSYSSPTTFVIDAGQGGAPVPVASYPSGGATVYSTTPSLSWYMLSAVSGSPTYDIELTTVSGNYSAPVRSYMGHSGISFTIPANDQLTPGQIYYWRVRTNNNGSQSAFSNEASFVVANVSSGNPTPFVSWPTGGNTVYSLTPTFSYYTNSLTAGDATFKIEIKPTTVPFDGVSANPILQSGITGYSYNLTSSLLGGTSYHWRVMLMSGSAGNSGWSTEGTFTTYTPSGAIAAPTLGQPDLGTAIENTSVSLSWFLTTAPTQEQLYRVELSKNSDMTSPFLELNDVGSLDKIVSALDEDIYYWRVQAKTSDGKYSEYSKTGNFILSGISDVKDGDGTIPKTFELSQNYPNPFNPSTVIEVALPEAGNYSLKIYNILGQQVADLVSGQLEAGNHSFNFDASELSTGLYIYTFRGSNINVSKKMILVK